MKNKKERLALVIYANPDYYPPVIGMISILAKDIDLVVICRNQDEPEFFYSDNVKLLRLGKLKTSRAKEQQNVLVKIMEYISFILSSIFFVRFYGCRLIYAYDMHGFVSGIIAGYCGKKIPVIYHNLDLLEVALIEDSSIVVKRLELFLARFADRVVFPDIHRARLFKVQAKLYDLPDVVMNTPLTIFELPKENRLLPLLKAKGVTDNPRVVLVQGTLSTANSIEQLVEAMTLLPKDTVLVLLGRGSPQDFIADIYRRADSLNIKERVIYLPPVPYRDLFCYTIGSYLGIALYRVVDSNRRYNAGASNKLFEYLSLGIPVVTNDTLPFREVVDETLAYFADPDSAEDIARLINSALVDREGYLRRSNAARARHLDKFNFEEQFKVVREYIMKKVNICR